MTTATTSIITDCGRFELNQVLWDETITSIWLNVLSKKKFSLDLKYSDYDIWDNEKYLLKLFKQLKSKTKNKKHYRELRDLCKERDWDFKEVRQHLKALFKESKRVGFNWELIEE